MSVTSLDGATKKQTKRSIATGQSRDRNLKSLIFLGSLWFALFFGVAVLIALIIDTMITGAPRFDGNLLTRYDSILFPQRTGFRAGILGSLWLMITTAAIAVPLGVGAATYLEEFSDSTKWYNRLIVMSLLGFLRVNIVLGGAVALALLILPVIIITAREAIRAVPREIRFGSLALGATQWQTTSRQVLPAAVPGIATGTILGLSRAIGEAAPLLMLGLALSVRFDPSSLFSEMTALPMQIYSMSSQSQVPYQQAAAAAIIVLLVMVLALNAVAILIRNKFQREW